MILYRPDTEDKTSDEALSITDTDPLERASTLRRVFLGDAIASTSKIKLKVRLEEKSCGT